MNILHLIPLLVLALLPTAWAGDMYHYQLEVKGMACAFCAYKTSQQLASLQGVERDSIQVHLETGQIRLKSSTLLQQAMVRDAVNSAGFQLVSLEPVKPDSMTIKPATQLMLRLEIPLTGVGANPINHVLERLGDLYAGYQQGYLEVTAPAKWEHRIMRPLLMGRQQVYPIRFTAASNNTETAILEWFLPSVDKGKHGKY